VVHFLVDQVSTLFCRDAFVFCQAMLSVIETTGAAYGSQKEDRQAIDEASSRAACV